MRVLLAAYPSVLVLDGLDEVPPSTNRVGVLESIREFMVDVATDQLDTLVVAMTRPQGYNDDFSPARYQHRYLSPLSAEGALEYATKLADVRFGHDPARRSRILARLQHAVQAEGTARLMTTPLQVTMMALLVDRVGHPPQERWALFDAYYNLVYQREIEREIPAASVLREHRTDIDAIHRRTAILLQVESERSGGTDARLSKAEFSAIVDRYLDDEGHSEGELSALRRRIIDAAMNRLVFLVGMEDDRIGFEIRSLQEFMASEALMEGDDELTRARLREIAALSSWRNVFLFAAGKCFSERLYLRDSIVQICAELNDGGDDAMSGAVREGSSLALELLEDGPAAKHPAKCRLLTRLALQLIDSGGLSTVSRLLAVFRPETAQIYLDELLARIERGQKPVASYAAACLVHLAEIAEGPFITVLEQVRPLVAASAVARDLLVRLSNGKDGFSRRIVVECLIGSEPVFARRLLAVSRSIPWDLDDDPPPWILGLNRLGAGDGWDRGALRVQVIGTTRVAFLRLRALDESTQDLLRGLGSMPIGHDGWRLMKAAEAFIVEPTVDSAIYALETARLAAAGTVEWAAEAAPWPLAMLLRIGLRVNDWSVLVRQVRDGTFGSAATWLSQEAIYSEQGVLLHQVIGRPILAAANSIDLVANSDALDEIVAQCLTNSGPERRTWLMAFNRLARTQRFPSGETLAFSTDRIFEAALEDGLGSIAPIMLDLGQVADPAAPVWSTLLPLLKLPSDSGENGDLADRLHQIVDAAWNREQSPELLIGFAHCLLRGHKVDLSSLSNVLDSDSSRSPHASIATVLLRIARDGRIDEVDMLVNYAGELPLGWYIVTALRSWESSLDEYVERLVQLCTKFRGSWLAPAVVRAGRAVLAERTSTMKELMPWRSLGLPDSLRSVVRS